MTKTISHTTKPPQCGTFLNQLARDTDMKYPIYNATMQYTDFVQDLTIRAGNHYELQIQEAELTDHLDREDCGDLDGILIKEEAEHYAEILATLIADEDAYLITIFLNDAFLNADDKTKQRLIEERDDNIYMMDFETQTQTAMMVLARVIANAFADKAMNMGYEIDNIQYMNE